VAAASLKSREATEAPQTGWSLTRKCFKTHSETSLASDHPVRAFSERDHFLMARPPLLGKEGNMPAWIYLQFLWLPLQKRGWYPPGGEYSSPPGVTNRAFCARPRAHV